MRIHRCVATCLLALALGTTGARAAGTVAEGRSLLAQGTTHADEERLGRARDLFLELARERVKDPAGSAEARYWAGYAYYRIAEAAALNGVDPRQVNELIDHAINQLRAAGKTGSTAETQALLAGCYARKIEFFPRAEGTLRLHFEEHMRLARAGGPENPRVLLLDGMSRYLSADEGSNDEALDKLRAASAAFASTGSRSGPAWGEADVHGWLGLALLEAGRPEEARAELERALELDTDRVWVRDHLMPRLSASGVAAGD